MKLSKEHIKLQNFKESKQNPYPTKCKILLKKTISKENHITIVFNHCNNYMEIINHFELNDNYVNALLYKGKINSLINFLLIYKKINEIIKLNTPEYQNKIVIPLNIYDDFISSDYKYTKKEFEFTIDLVLLSLLSQELYEKCQPLIDFRKNYFKSRKWKYYDIHPDKFTSYNNILS